jgi:hypothetical protein
MKLREWSTVCTDGVSLFLDSGRSPPPVLLLTYYLAVHLCPWHMRETRSTAQLSVVEIGFQMSTAVYSTKWESRQDCTGFELMLSPPISVPRAGPKWSIWSNQTFDFSYSWLRDSATAVLSSARSSTDGFIQDNPSLWTLDCGSLRIHWKEGINWINAGCFFFRYLCKLPLGSICRDCRWF